MENIEYQVEQPLLSVNEKHKTQGKMFKQYLVQSGTMMHFVKFLLGLRNKQIADDYVPSSDAIQMFKEYFGSIQPDTTEQDKLRELIHVQKQSNNQIKSQLEQIKAQIKNKKQQIARKAQEKRLKQQEEAKNPKKGKK